MPTAPLPSSQTRTRPAPEELKRAGIGIASLRHTGTAGTVWFRHAALPLHAGQDLPLPGRAQPSRGGAADRGADPGSWRPGELPQLRPGRAVGTREIVAGYPYLLVYEVDRPAGVVRILRVWHSAQNR